VLLWNGVEWGCSTAMAVEYRRQSVLWKALGGRLWILGVCVLHEVVVASV
jgi:hypothetical protein